MVKLFIVLACGTVALAVVVRIIEPRFAFFPSTGERPTPADLGIPFASATLRTADGEELRAWELRNPDRRALVVYFHGNGGNLSVWVPILADVYGHGFTVAAIDYRGYGASSGSPTERGLYRDVDAALDWARGLAQPGIPVVYWGRSLGTTMAAYAATKRAPDGLILESGFPSARALTRASPPLAFLGLFSTYRFPTADYAKSVRCPILVMHGDADRVIPFSHGLALYEALSGAKRFVTIPGGDHNDMTPSNPDAYWTAVREFITTLRGRQTVGA
jgi:fermentation-respiration switch protein FrsA (DUF1100 family)